MGSLFPFGGADMAYTGRFECVTCGQQPVRHPDQQCSACFHADTDDGDTSEPIGSCDECGGNLYGDEEEYDGMCSQCAWYAEQG